MKERFMIKCAVFLILTKIENNKEYILLQRRYNTGILDGQYDVSSSGHLENGETLKESIIRETKEELGIEISDAIFVINKNNYIGKSTNLEIEYAKKL